MLLGCDFSSSPTRRKPIVLALGRLHGSAVHLERFERFTALPDFGAWLAQPGDWVGGFDLPFGLPRELVLALGWPTDWAACMAHYAGFTRAQLRALFQAFCAGRSVGGKFAHRATDGPAGASPSMKWVNPPVAWMLHAGVPLLRAAGVHLPGLADGDGRRVALEAYPGLLAREALGGRRSYKSDDPKRQTPARHQARADLMAALCAGEGARRLGLRLVAAPALHAAMVDDASGDLLDATLCMVQAGWAQGQHAAGDPRFGMPADCDPLEGWILTA
ncbi:DUF429 domain-containing protein [Pseudorhodoferax sp. Leaf274]|uniref:DUF429 domain-containing protein n=1 Tax=Pseudorhodoferax sp. Leaf274 TaxID=1736318 RepID=UPI0007033549|nr:DUF429 domain-containing protein [Pseudorhodoferax sp. Leaf274]KQP39985.1 hypothetical protein ASF44_09800 [Pseudorhodoferax sp. Leaf274]